MLSPFRWARIRWPKAPTGSLGLPRPPRPTRHDRVVRARLRGERQMDDWTLFFGVVISATYGYILWAGLWLTWLKWPALVVAAFVVARNLRRRIA